MQNAEYKKPHIGVTTSVGKGHMMWRCIRLGIWLAGGRAIRLTAEQHVGWQAYDGYLIAGGADIDPSRYGQKNTKSLQCEPARDQLELEVITHAIDAAKPMAGICRGAQMINVTLGGTLHQDARDIYEDFLPTTHMLGKIFSRRTVHILSKIIGQGCITAMFGRRSSVRVNSIHHQAVDQLGDGLVITAKDRHKIAQAIETTKEGQYVFGVQWHPEFMLYRTSQRVFFRLLVDACQR